ELRIWNLSFRELTLMGTTPAPAGRHVCRKADEVSCQLRRSGMFLDGVAVMSPRWGWRSIDDGIYKHIDLCKSSCPLSLPSPRAGESEAGEQARGEGPRVRGRASDP